MLPDLYSFADDEDAYINSCLEPQNEESMCFQNVNFARAFNDWELELVNSMFDILYSNILMRKAPIKRV